MTTSANSDTTCAIVFVDPTQGDEHVPASVDNREFASVEEAKAWATEEARTRGEAFEVTIEVGHYSDDPYVDPITGATLIDRDWNCGVILRLENGQWQVS